MKYASLISTFVLLLFAASLFAHPASEVTASYDKETMILTVEYKHDVSDPTKHFIDDIEVILAKKDLVVQKLMSQDTIEGGKVLYKIRDLKPGDVLKIKTDCNRFGGKSIEYTIE